MRTPLWVTILIILFTLPVFTLPTLLARCSPDQPTTQAMVWIYPFYLLLSAYLAWRVYPQRPYLTWLLIVIMALTTLSMFLLTSV